MSPLVAAAVAQGNLVAATLSADDGCNSPWALLHAGGWLSTAAQEAREP